MNPTKALFLLSVTLLAAVLRIGEPAPAPVDPDPGAASESSRGAATLFGAVGLPPAPEPANRPAPERPTASSTDAPGLAGSPGTVIGAASGAVGRIRWAASRPH